MVMLFVTNERTNEVYLPMINVLQTKSGRSVVNLRRHVKRVYVTALREVNCPFFFVATLYSTLSSCVYSWRECYKAIAVRVIDKNRRVCLRLRDVV